MRKTLPLFVTCLILFSCGKTDDPASPIVARVGKSVLTNADVEHIQMSVSNNTYSKKDIIANWIDRELLYYAAQEAGIENDKVLETKIEAYRKELFGRTFLDNYASANIVVDNSEIRSHYDANRAMFRHDSDGARIIHFFVNTDTTADFIAETLRSSDESVDRKILLSDYNAEVLTVEQGNNIDILDDAIFSNNRINVILGPLKTDYGYHVIEVLNRYRSGSQIALDEVYDEIYQIIFNRKKQLRSTALIDSLRNHYNIKIYLENN